MIIALTALVFGAVCGARVVTRAKKLMSVFMRGHGSVPLRPIPRRWWWECAGDVEVEVEVGTGVVATMRVNGGGEGIFSFGMSFAFLLGGVLGRGGSLERLICEVVVKVKLVRLENDSRPDPPLVDFEDRLDIKSPLLLVMDCNDIGFQCFVGLLGYWVNGIDCVVVLSTLGYRLYLNIVIYLTKRGVHLEKI